MSDQNDPIMQSDVAKPAPVEQHAPETQVAEKTSDAYPRALSGMAGAGAPDDIPLTPQNMLYLQRTVGNQATTTLIQARLKVGQPNDVYEQEADRAAEQVMRMPESALPATKNASQLNEKGRKDYLPPISALTENKAVQIKSISRIPVTSQTTSSIQRKVKHKVVGGETLWSIAHKYGISVESIKQTNKLSSNSIKPDMVLTIPEIHYAVKKDDTLWRIANKHKIPLDVLKDANGLKTNTIQKGDVLVIPPKYTVGSKDTLWSIAQKYNVKVPELKKVNKLKTNQINAGDVLIIPIQPQSSPGKGKPATPPGKSSTKGAPKTPTKPTGTTPKSPVPPSSNPVLVKDGHLPGHDYKQGNVREHSFLRESDLKTLQKNGKEKVFFKKGQKIELVSSKEFWVKVKGETYYDQKSPKPVLKSGSKTPLISTGWIKREWTDMSKGKYTGLGIDDRSYELGKLGYPNHMSKSNVKNIVLHQTDSSTTSSTMSQYKGQIKKGKHIGSQYLISKDGKTYLIVPVDRKVGHVKPDIQFGKDKKVFNSRSIGIEHVGRHYHITPASKYTDSKGMERVRKEIRNLSLSPRLKSRLLGLNNRNLFNELRGSGRYGWDIYQDISAQQKRATHLLTSKLMTDFGLDLKDIYAHEKVQAKVIGEGENIKEFLETMNKHSGLLKKLDQLGSGITDLSKIIHNEKEVEKSINLDGSVKEQEQFAKEKAAGAKGAATKRENLRLSFYANFYIRIKQLNDMVRFLETSAGKTPDRKKLKAKIATWQF